MHSIDDGIKADIEEGQRLRGWIANSYAQIEFLLGDLIIRCRAFPEYSAETATFTHSASKRAKQVQKILATKGPLSTFAMELNSIIDRFNEHHETRNLLAHGLCEYLHAANGDSAMQFQKWHRQKSGEDVRLIRICKIDDLRVERDKFVSLASEAVALFMRMHKKFEWTVTKDR